MLHNHENSLVSTKILGAKGADFQKEENDFLDKTKLGNSRAGRRMCMVH